MTPAVDVNLLSGVTRKMISDFERNCRLYRGDIDVGEDLAADIPANFVDYVDDIFSRERLSETSSGSSFTAGECSVISKALARLSKTVPISGSKLTDLVRV